MADPKNTTTASTAASTASSTDAPVKKTRAKAGEGKQRNLGPKGVAKALRSTVNRINTLLVQSKKENLTLDLSLDPAEGKLVLGKITFSESF